MSQRKVIGKIVNAIYPSICVVCNTLYRSAVCLSCYRQISFLKDIRHCKMCGKLSFYGICRECASLSKYISPNNIHSVLLHNDDSSFARKIIYNLKNTKSPLVVNIIAHFMLRYTGDIFEKCDLLIPVPSTVPKRIVRGYCQTTLVTNRICKILNIEKANNILYRKYSNAKNQKSMSSRVNREINIKKIKYYVLNPKRLYNKNIVIFDDTITTGLTMQKCYYLLSQYKCKSIHITSFSRTIIA